MRKSIAYPILLALFTVGVAAEESDVVSRRANDSRFLGLWEGVDLNDGSKRTVSITDSDNDGVLEVAARDTYWTLCDGDRALDLGSGTVDHGVLTVHGVVTCFDDDIELLVETTYELDKKRNTLLATPLGTGLIAPTLHRVSD